MFVQSGKLKSRDGLCDERLFIDQSDVMLQNGLTALHLAAKEGRYNVVFELLKRGADLNSTSKVRSAVYNL